MDLSKVQLVKDYYLDNYNVYINGYIYKDTKKPAYEAKKLTSYYYICSVCNEKKIFTKLSKFLHKKEEFKFCCQKCATRINTQKDSFKRKQSAATKMRWNNGGFENLKKSEKFLNWEKNNCRNMLYKTPEEKQEIALKKIKTWLKHTEEEKQEINYRRTKHLLESLKKAKCDRKFVPAKRFLTKEWYDLRTKVINRDKFTCQKCKKILTKSELNVHHLIPYRFCQENKEQNLISLCKSCHSKVERFLEKNCILDENNIDLKKELDFIYENEKDDIKNNREISYTR